MVDKPALDQMLSNLRRYTMVLRDLAAVRRDDFLSNPDKIGNAKYHFVIAIECAIAVGSPRAHFGHSSTTAIRKVFDAGARE